MIRILALLFLSLFPVLLGCLFAIGIWSLTAIFDPLWRASFAVFSWIVGFAIGTTTFWKAAARINSESLAQ